MPKTMAQIRFDLGNWLRNGEQAILNILLPLGALAASTRLTLTGEDRAALVILFAIGASSFTSIAISTAFDRRAGALKVYGISPLGRRGFVQARIATAAILTFAQIFVLTLVAMISRIDFEFSLTTLAFAVLSQVAWISLALIFASIFRAEAVLALANLLFVSAVALTWFTQQTASLFGLATPMSCAALAISGNTVALASLAAWVIVSLSVAIKTLRWE